MGAHVDRVCRRTAQRIDGEVGMGKLVRHYFVELQAGLEDGTLAENDPQVAESVVDLVRTIYLRPSTAGTHVSTADMLRTQIKAFIDANLTDPALSPEDMRAPLHLAQLPRQAVTPPRARACGSPSRPSGSTAAGATCSTRRWTASRSSRSPCAGASSARRTSAARSVATYGVSPRDFRATFRAP